MAVTKEDVTRIVELVRNVIDDIDARIVCEVAGGFRRGKSSGHDVDILVRNLLEDRGNEVELLSKIENKLQPQPLQVILQSSVSERKKATRDRHATCLGLFNLGNGRPFRR